MKKEVLTTIKHCLKAQQFDLATLYRICELTDKVKEIGDTKEGLNWMATLLNDKRALLFFTQPSTRTFLSFKNACDILGIKSTEIRDIATSSFAKDETLIDSAKTFAQYVDLIIMRLHPAHESLIEEAPKKLNDRIRIINAGSGSDQHPTQALLDFYTIYKYGFAGKNIGFVGDLQRGRTVRSLALLLTKLDNLKLYFIAPPAYQIKDDILKQLTVSYELVYDFDQIIPELNVVYMTRLQKEYGGNDVPYNQIDYSIHEGNLNKFKKDAIIMHPLPRGSEIAPSVDDDCRAKYWEQVHNGLWVRVALIALMYGMDYDIIAKSSERMVKTLGTIN